MGRHSSLLSTPLRPLFDRSQFTALAILVTRSVLFQVLKTACLLLASWNNSHFENEVQDDTPCKHTKTNLHNSPFTGFYLLNLALFEGSQISLSKWTFNIHILQVSQRYYSKYKFDPGQNDLKIVRNFRNILASNSGMFCVNDLPNVSWMPT